MGIALNQPPAGGRQPPTLSAPTEDTSGAPPIPLRHRLRQHLPAWKSAGASPQVQEWISRGARCEWLSGPPPPYDYGVSLAKPGDLTADQSLFLEKEIARHHETGAWEHAPEGHRTHICRVHLVPKKVPPGEPPKWRIVVDLRPTNSYCVRRSCKYETLKSLSRWAAKGSWAFSWDMKDGYHQVGVAREHRRYMTFALPPAPGSPPGTPPRYIRSAALPFGWCDSPRVFSKVMKVMVRMLRSPWAPGLPRLRHSTRSGRAFVLRRRERGRSSPESTGMRLLPYVDDFLALAATRREALRCRERVDRVLTQLGLTRHPSKGDWEPTQRLEHLGIDIDLKDGLFRVPPRKLLELRQQARSIAAIAAQESRLIPVRRLAAFVGFAQSVYLACPSARFYLREFHNVMATRTSWEARVRLTRQALADLRWWQQLGVSASVARAIWRPPTDRTLECDASHLGWGGVLDGTVPAQGMWTGRSRGRHINFLELMAVHHTLQVFLKELQGESVLLWEDNMTVVHILTNRTTRSPELMHLLRRVWWLIDSAGIDLQVRYVASKDNAQADALSRGSPWDDLTLLPQVWRDLDGRWGPHTVDRYASSESALLPRFNSLLPHENSEGAGALSQSWVGENNFVFPPPSELPRVAQLLFENPRVRATVVAPHWPAQAWFQQLTELAVRVEVRPLHGAALPAEWLHASARTALSNAMLACFRVGACPAGF